MSSKADIFDQISPSQGDIFDKISSPQKQISKTRSVISAPAKGVIKGLSDLGKLFGGEDTESEVLRDVYHATPEQVHNLENEREQLGLNAINKALPTRNESTENLLERAGKLAPTAALGGGGLVNTVLQAGLGSALGQIAEEEGIGETGQGLAEIAGMGIPGIAKAVGKKALSLVKSPVEKLTSGLTKPRAIEAKFPAKAVISPERQEKSINKLNEEASRLTQQTVEKELPIAKQIEKGFDFESQFEKKFGSLQNIAEKANPEINVTPLSKFFSETASKYRGIPKLHPEASKISTEISAFNRRPQSDLKKLLRIYRSNNKKIKGIYETSRLTGKQQEYVDFLVGYNKNIAQSFENTLPKDSAWVKEFKDLNREYKQYKDTQKTLHLLEPILKQKATPASISKIADDPKILKKLQLSIGEKGASEVSQIAKDLKLATESVKKIPARDLKWYEGVLPLSILIPGVHLPGGAVAAKKGFDFARRGYGWFLSTPSRRSSYNNALKAIAEDNRALYLKSIEELEKSLQSED